MVAMHRRRQSQLKVGSDYGPTRPRTVSKRRTNCMCSSMSLFNIISKNLDVFGETATGDEKDSLVVVAD